MPCEQRSDGDMYLVAVEVEQLSMTPNASSTTVEQCHLEMVVHRFGVFAQPEQSTEGVVGFGDDAQGAGARCLVGDLVGGGVVAKLRGGPKARKC